MKIRGKVFKFNPVILVFALMISYMTFSISSVYAGDVSDSEIKGSITVHKYASIVESNISGTGLEVSLDKISAFGKALNNVGFTLYKVNDGVVVDHTTTPATAKENSTKISELFTSSVGVCSWDNLDEGYYVLSETTPHNGKYEKPSDSIITLPMGITESRSDWNYDIHVYPKSIRTVDVSKVVIEEQASYSVGDIAVWRIGAKLAYQLKAEDNYADISIHDQLDSRLTFDTASEIVFAIGGDEYPIMLYRNRDYTADVDSNNKLTIKLTSLGIDRIVEDNATGISIEFSTTVNRNAIDSSTNNSTKIYNNALLEGADATGNEIENSVPEDDIPHILLSGIRVIKVDSEDKDTLLDGAEFKIALNRENADKGVFIKRENTEEDIVLKTGDSAALEDIKTGEGMFTGLLSSESSDQSYFIVETKSPVGYVLRKSPIKVVMPKDSKIGLVTIENQKIGNPPLNEERPTFPLPSTGGVGTLIFTMIGSLLILSAVLLIIRVRAKKNYKRDRYNKA